VLRALSCPLALAAAVLAASRDQEHYYGDPAMTSALAQEHYYRSYPAPETRKAPQAASDGNTLLKTALSIGGALVLVAAGLAGHQRNTSPHGGVPA
jgi:hypothetical protein